MAVLFPTVKGANQIIDWHEGAMYKIDVALGRDSVFQIIYQRPVA
jgi:hypothetical protein